MWIIGLPNVGKSTYLMHYANTSADTANTIITIEPNVGNVIVQIKDLNELAKIANSKNIIPTQMQFVDIAV